MMDDISKIMQPNAPKPLALPTRLNTLLVFPTFDEDLLLYTQAVHNIDGKTTYSGTLYKMPNTTEMEGQEDLHNALDYLKQTKVPSPSTLSHFLVSVGDSSLVPYSKLTDFKPY